MMGRTFVLPLVLFILLGVSLPAQELAIDYSYNVVSPDTSNYLTFRSPVRYVGTEKDSYDSVSGASRFKATSFFAPIQTDMQGKATFPTGFRGILLFPVAPASVRIEDNLRVTKAADGVITMEYVHRGVAYKTATDRTGKIGFPRGNFAMRTIGYIQGDTPQVISRDFSPDGTAASVDWKKVWDPRSSGGKEILPGVPARTGAIQNDYGDYMAMFNWDGVLQVGFDNNILKISGSLKPVKR
jgi:hypothetical protein